METRPRVCAHLTTPFRTQVKNRSAAPVQITAEQLLREAKDRIEAEPKETVQKIQDAEELASYRFVCWAPCRKRHVVFLMRTYPHWLCDPSLFTA